MAKNIYGDYSGPGSGRFGRLDKKYSFIPLLPKGRIDNVLYHAQISLRSEAIQEQSLWKILDQAADAEEAVVFPSHFFEFDQKQDCLQRLKTLGLTFWVQVSPGAELKDYFLELDEMASGLAETSWGVEVVMDRAPGSSDWQLLKRLSDRGIQLRYVFCPVRGFDAAEELAHLPAQVLKELYFYFPEKKDVRDEFLNSDDIFLLIKKLEEKVPSYKIKVCQHLLAAEPAPETKLARHQFRHNPTEELYLKNFSELEGIRSVRAVFLRAARSAIFFPLVTLPHFFIFFVMHPLKGFGLTWRWILGMQVIWHSAVKAYYRMKVAAVVFRHHYREILSVSLAQAVIFVYKSKHIFSLSYRTAKHISFVLAIRAISAYVGFATYSRYYLALSYYKALHLIRCAYVPVFCGIMKAYFYACHLFFLGKVKILSTFYFCKHLLLDTVFACRHFFFTPTWAIQTYLPFLYKYLLVPSFKIYWFMAYQLNKRVLGRNAGLNK